MYDPTFFDPEINMISQLWLKTTVRGVLKAAPEYFWTAPASMTGKYHPFDSNGVGGLCRHTKKVVWFACNFARALLQVSEDDPDFPERRDRIIAAALIHDTRKFGPGPDMGTYDQYAKHDVAAADWLAELVKPLNAQNKVVWDYICQMVKWHMGRWGSCSGDERTLYIVDHYILHLADVAASDKHFVAKQFYTQSIMESAGGYLSDIPSVRETADLADSSAYNERRYFNQENGVYRLNFGKHKNDDIDHVVSVYPGYVRDYILKKDFPEYVKDVFRKRLEAEETRKKQDRQLRAGVLPFG